jgi:hypothetical protein
MQLTPRAGYPPTWHSATASFSTLSQCSSSNSLSHGTTTTLATTKTNTQTERNTSRKQKSAKAFGSLWITAW